MTLLTDFGTADPYVAAMKGAALSVNDGLSIVDLTHEVPPQDVLAGALALEAAAPYFPPGTIHVAVVDPGVGSKRRAIAAASPRLGHVFVGPDNGLLSLAWGADPDLRVVALEEKRFFRDAVSATFHGRDVFAPVAAHLSLGVPLGDLGPVARDPIRIAVPPPRRRPGGGLRGEVIAVDRFGNCVTNLDRAALDSEFSRRGPKSVRIAGRDLGACVRTYSDLPAEGTLGALVGSTGRLEIALRGGNAAAALLARRGTPVDVS